MPTYEYECLKCRHRFEVEQRLSEPALTECPGCHGLVRRVISTGGGFIIKGAGGRSNHPPGGGKSCAYTQTGKTCCGRDSRCDKPPCDSER